MDESEFDARSESFGVLASDGRMQAEDTVNDKAPKGLSHQRVLVCGHRSFASHGLIGQLVDAGHAVTCFTRGDVRREGNVVYGPALQLHENEQLAGPFDVVVNYILLKDHGIDENIEYVRSLTEFCRTREVKHLIHISSVSVFDGSARRVTETSAVERDPTKKGSYGALKVATENYLVEHLGHATLLTVLRPGFILGPGVISPIVGMAFRLPWNRLLLLGSHKNMVPLITRDLVNAAVGRLVERPPGSCREFLLLVDSTSPTRREYLDACCRLLGVGLGVTSFPPWLWRVAGLGGEALARLVRLKIRVNRMIGGACRVQRFNANESEQRLGLRLSIDWPAALQASLDGQQPNFILPYDGLPCNAFQVDKVTYLGVGRIVRQKHLTAIQKLRYNGRVEAYDLHEFQDRSGLKVQAIDDARVCGSGLAVVATPGPVHHAALKHLSEFEGPVLVEKPLGYDSAEVDRWSDYAASRTAGVFVCHNYRFKANVKKMLDTVSRFNPGALLNVDLQFQSPPVANEQAAWLRNERRARTLLMDYGIHFLDLACMWWRGPWDVTDVRHQIDGHGDTSLIEGRLKSEAYTVNLLLRQGFMPRCAEVAFTFRNYQVKLGFFPDTCTVVMSNGNPFINWAETRNSAGATIGKVADRLLGRDHDESHATIYRAVTDATCNAAAGLRVENLRYFYEMLFAIGESVYDPGPLAQGEPG